MEVNQSRLRACCSYARVTGEYKNIPHLINLTNYCEVIGFENNKGGNTARRDGMKQEIMALVQKIGAITKEVLTSHIGRGDVVKATWLALVSGRPAFFLGTPGVDKTGVVRAMANRISGCVFYDALMPMITSPEQLLVEKTSIKETTASDGGKEISTSDMLGRAAVAHIFFGDEVWKAEPRVLNTTLDLEKGDGIRHEGRMIQTPLLASLSASNELPDQDGNLGAAWSRKTIRVKVESLDRAGKEAFAKARLNASLNVNPTPSELTLAEVEELRLFRKSVAVSDEIVGIVLDIYQELANDASGAFAWLWADDRRFGRVFDVLQANALLSGRDKVCKPDLAVLEWLLWDTPEQIAAVKTKIAPYIKTPLTDAQELVDSLLSPSGVVTVVLGGNRGKGVEALTQCESAGTEIMRLLSEASDDAMRQAIIALGQQVEKVKADVIGVVTGVKR